MFSTNEKEMINIITLEQQGKNGIVEIHAGGKKKYIHDFAPYYYNQDKKKIICESPIEVKERLKLLDIKGEKHYEGDVKYLQRYLIDKVKLPIKKEFIRICNFDIETDGSLDIDNTPKPVIAITAHDNVLKTYITFVWKKNLEPKTVRNEGHTTFYFDNEKDMLKKFVAFIKDTNPEMITGFNIINYDLPYLTNRMKLLRVNPAELSPFNYIDGRGINSDYAQFIIKGRVVFDSMVAYKKIIKGELQYASLNFVAKQLGIETKIDLDVADMWVDIPRLVSYNKHDVWIVNEILKKTRMVEHFDTRRRENGITWDSVFYVGNIADVNVLRKAKEFGIILPTRRTIRNKPKYPGAYKITKLPGLHKWIVSIDLKRLYPSMNCQFNISPDTKSEDGDIRCIKAHYKSDIKGIIPELLKESFYRREMLIKMMKTLPRDSDEWYSYYLMQYSEKVKTNAVYGYCGSRTSRWGDMDVATDIAGMAKKVTLHCVKIVEDAGYKIIMTDTDGIHIASGYDNLDDCIALGYKIRDMINATFDKFVQQYGCKKNEWIRMEFKEVYETGFYTTAKSRYVADLVWDDGRAVKERTVKSFESIRADASDFTKEVQNKLFDILLSGGKKADVILAIKEMKNKVKEDKDYDLVAIPKKCKKNFDEYDKDYAYLRGIFFMNEHYKTGIRKNDRFKMLYVHGVSGKPAIDCVCYKKSLKGIPVIMDWSKQFNSIIDKKIDKIFTDLDWEKGLKSEAKLDKWFK